jgi:hypothetical protein
MGFGGKVDNRIHLFPSQNFCDQGGITDVTLYKPVLSITGYGCKIIQIAGICQQVKVRNPAARVVGDERMNKIGADKTSSSGNQYR